MAGDLAGTTATLVVEACAPTAHGPDDLRFAVVDDAGVHELHRLDGRYLSTEVAGGFTGRTIGLRALGNAATVLAVTYEPAANAAP